MALSVAVLSGGLSLERDVSLRSGHRIADSLTSRGHDVTRLDLTDRLVSALTAGSFDVAALALHGKAGEDGTIQGLLDLLAIPYTGPDAVASALAWDKGVFKGMARRAGLPTPPWVAVSAAAIRDMGAARALDGIAARLGLPLVVKPAQGGSSMGVLPVLAAADLAGALVAGLSYHDVVLAEAFVAGHELAVSIVDGEALPPVEIVPPEGGSYDFSARYTAGATDFYAPARLPDDVLQRCIDVALAAYELVGARHITRVDLIVDADDRPWLLELNTCPGMTETSLLPMAVGAAGRDLADVCDLLVRRAVDPRH